MSKKNLTQYDKIIYSTDKNFKTEEEIPQQNTLPPAQQKLRIRIETKLRAGKTVTVINGFVGTNTDLESLGKKLKTHCGAGGTIDEGEIIVQGQHKEKVLQWLIKNGYTNSK